MHLLKISTRLTTKQSSQCSLLDSFETWLSATKTHDERLNLSAFPDGLFSGFSHHLCSAWRCTPTHDDHCRMAVAQNTRACLSGGCEALGQRGGDPFCHWRVVGNRSLLRTGT